MRRPAASAQSAMLMRRPAASAQVANAKKKARGAPQEMSQAEEVIDKEAGVIAGVIADSEAAVIADSEAQEAEMRDGPELSQAENVVEQKAGVRKRPSAKKLKVAKATIGTSKREAVAADTVVTPGESNHCGAAAEESTPTARGAQRKQWGLQKHRQKFVAASIEKHTAAGLAASQARKEAAREWMASDVRAVLISSMPLAERQKRRLYIVN